MEEQMVGPEFDSLNEWQKKLISVPYGFVIGALERYGIAALGEGANPVVNRFATAIVNRTMLSLPKDATVDTIKREINKNVGAMIAQGALKVVGGSLVEGGTEATQQLFEIGEKFLVNKIVGSDKEPGFEYFKDVPDITTADGLKKAFEIAGTDFYYGALGGLLMSGGVNAYQTTKQNSFNKKTDKEFEAFYDSMTDDKLRKLNILNTKIKLKNGEITKEEAKETIDAINSSSQKLKSLNPNLSIRDKKDAFNLMLQRDKLEQEKAPLDEAMQAPYNERITNINNELKTISENAVKESTVEEVTAEGGGIQREGTQEGQPEVGQGEGAVGQAAQPETDLGNRPVEGRSAEEERVTRNVINRPATLSEFGGKTFDTPLQGDTYVDGQQVVFEDRATGRIYELGNIDEVMDSAIPGLQAQEETISITPEGKVSIEGNNWNIQSELPTQGIEYNPAGEVTRVSLKDDAGNTQMFEGQQAVDIAYQIELQKIQSTEQQQFINDLLEQDEEFQTATESIKPRQTEAVVQEETAPDIVPTEPTVEEEVVNIFNINTKLADIGTQEEYSEYINTIFPNSKVKDILYHGSEEKNELDDFDESKIKLNHEYLAAGNGYYLSNDKNYAKLYGNKLTFAIVNFENPAIINTSDQDFLALDRSERDKIIENLLKTHDSIIDNREDDYYKDGKLQTKGNYLNGLYSGECVWYNAQEKAEERWRPILGVEAILMSVISMLNDPNDESPANIDAAKQWREDKDAFKKRVRMCVRKSQEEC